MKRHRRRVHTTTKWKEVKCQIVFPHFRGYVYSALGKAGKVQTIFHIIIRFGCITCMKCFSRSVEWSEQSQFEEKVETNPSTFHRSRFSVPFLSPPVHIPPIAITMRKTNAISKRYSFTSGEQRTRWFTEEQRDSRRCLSFLFAALTTDLMLIISFSCVCSICSSSALDFRSDSSIIIFSARFFLFLCFTAKCTSNSDVHEKLLCEVLYFSIKSALSQFHLETEKKMIVILNTRHEVSRLAATTLVENTITLGRRRPKPPRHHEKLLSSKLFSFPMWTWKYLRAAICNWFDLNFTVCFACIFLPLWHSFSARLEARDV